MSFFSPHLLYLFHTLRQLVCVGLQSVEPWRLAPTYIHTPRLEPNIHVNLVTAIKAHSSVHVHLFLQNLSKVPLPPLFLPIINSIQQMFK